MEFAVLPATFVLGPIDEGQLSLATHFVLVPLAFIFVTKFVDLGAIAMLDDLTHVDRAIVAQRDNFGATVQHRVA